MKSDRPSRRVSLPQIGEKQDSHSLFSTHMPRGRPLISSRRDDDGPQAAGGEACRTRPVLWSCIHLQQSTTPDLQRTLDGEKITLTVQLKYTSYIPYLLLLLSQHSIRHRFQNRRRLQADAFLGLCPPQCHFLVIAKPRSAPAIVTPAIDHLLGIPSPSGPPIPSPHPGSLGLALFRPTTASNTVHHEF